MNPTIGPILLGIASSLIATFIFLWLNWLFKTILLPWFADKIYRGVRIDGRWCGVLIGGAKINSITSSQLQLTQKGDELTGLYSHTISSKKSEFYTIGGFVRDAIVTLNWKPSTKDTIDAGSAILRVFTKDSTLRMKGILTYISTESNEVKSSSIEFEKQTA
jgi:hypothetical protein